MSFRLEVSVKTRRIELRGEPIKSSFILSGTTRTKSAEIMYTVEGKSAVIDARKVGLRQLLHRPRAVLEELGELRELAEELAARGYRVEVRVRGIKVASYP